MPLVRKPSHGNAVLDHRFKDLALLALEGREASWQSFRRASQRRSFINVAEVILRLWRAVPCRLDPPPGGLGGQLHHSTQFQHLGDAGLPRHRKSSRPRRLPWRYLSRLAMPAGAIFARICFRRLHLKPTGRPARRSGERSGGRPGPRSVCRTVWRTGGLGVCPTEVKLSSISFYFLSVEGSARSRPAPRSNGTSPYSGHINSHFDDDPAPPRADAAQAGGVCTFVADGGGSVDALRSRTVKPKRGHLATKLFKDFRWEIVRRMLRGLLIRPRSLPVVLMQGHSRFGTSSSPEVNETHPHQWLGLCACYWPAN